MYTSIRLCGEKAQYTGRGYHSDYYELLCRLISDAG
jgi:hypothetical protein